MSSGTMKKRRGKYSSPIQVERRERILQETLKFLESGSIDDVNMNVIAERSGVSTKTLYNIFKNRNGLLLAAASMVNAANEESTAGLGLTDGIARIFELTHRAIQTFIESPEFMESTISIVLGISPAEEADHHRIGRSRQWFYSALEMAKAQGELLPDADCKLLSNILTASQWGTALLWQKGLIDLAEFRRQTLLKHCVDLMPCCSAEKKAWLTSEMQRIQAA